MRQSGGLSLAAGLTAATLYAWLTPSGNRVRYRPPRPGGGATTGADLIRKDEVFLFGGQ